MELILHWDGLIGLGLTIAAIIAPEYWPAMPNLFRRVLAAIAWIFIIFAVKDGAEELFDMKLRNGPAIVFVIGMAVVGISIFWQLEIAKSKEDFPKKVEKSFSGNEGILVPGNKPTPQLPGNRAIPDGSLAVLFGSNVSINSQFPHVLLRLGGEDMIVINRDATGGNLKITTLRIFDDRDEIIARIDQNEFWVKNTNRAKRPDEHTLIVYDYHDEQVLKLEFLNPQIVQVEGIFRSSKINPSYAVITPTEMRIMPNRMTLTGNTMINSAADIVVN